MKKGKNQMASPASLSYIFWLPLENRNMLLAEKLTASLDQ